MAKKRARSKAAQLKSPELSPKAAEAFKTATRKFNPNKPAIGVHENISFENYCAIDAINHHSLIRVRHSLRAYKYGIHEKTGPYFSIGSIIHTGQLETDLFHSRYIVIPEKDFIKKCPKKNDKGEAYKNIKATSPYKQLVKDFTKQAEKDGKQVVSQSWFDDTLECLRSINANKRAKEYLTADDGQTELTIIWRDPDTGLLCKGRIDFASLEHKKRITDLKTTADTNWFGYDFGKYNYHQQAAFYHDGLYFALNPRKKSYPPQQYEACIVAAEKAKPYCCTAAPVHKHALLTGRDEYRDCLTLVAEATKRKKWPGPFNPAYWELQDNYYTYSNPPIEKVFK